MTSAVSLFSPPAARRVMAGIAAIFASVTLAGAEAARDGKEWVEELSAVYGKLDGFIADYLFETEGKRLEARLAADHKSGLVAMRVVGEKDGEAVLDARQWNTLNDEMFVDADGERLRVSGAQRDMTRLMTDLSELYDLFVGKDDPEMRLGFTANWQAKFLLGQDNGIVAAIGMASQSEPFWASEAKDAPVKGSDDVSVTFSTEEHGLLTVSREHGLLLRQSVKGSEGEDRILELKELVKNPGREKLEELTAAWPTDGARDMGDEMIVKMVAGMRHKIFQAVVDAVSEGKGKPEAVGRWMELNRGRLEHLADPWVMEGPGRLEAAEFWDGLLERLEGEVPDGVEVRRFMRIRENRESLRESAVTVLSGTEETARKAVGEIFMDSELKADNEAGGEAKDLIEANLAKVYLMAIFDRKARAKWGGYEEK